MVMGIKNMYKIEGVINTRDLGLHFINRSIPYSYSISDNSTII